MLRDCFGAADLPLPQRRALLDHLQICSRCRERLRRLQRPESLLARQVAARVFKPASPSKVLSGQLLDRLTREQEEAPRLIDRLLNQPPERRQLLLRNQLRYQSIGLTKLLLDRSAEEVILRGSRPSEDLARLALSVADRLAPQDYGRPIIEDMRALSWARIANALRTRSDLEGSDAAFSKAFTHLRRGTGDLFQKATCLDLKASLLRAQRKLQEARSLLERSVAIFQEIGESHAAGRSLLNLELVFFIAGDIRRGIPILARALSLLDQRREPRLMLFAAHNLAGSLSRGGRPKEARIFLDSISLLYDQFTSRSMQFRRQWLEGEISLQLGRPAEAQILLTSARDGFLADERYQEASLVSEDLCTFNTRRRG